MELTFRTRIFPVYFNSFVVPGADMVMTHDKDWRKLYPSVGNNLSRWTLRSLIVVREGSVVLIDTGFGNKQSEAFFRPFQLEGSYTLDSQLKDIGLTTNDITDVVLTHLHYDHCGGCLLKQRDKIVPAFPRAKLWISETQWETARNPVEKEQESFPEENIKPLEDYYPIQLADEGGYLPGIYFKIVNGHTRGQLIPLIRLEKENLLFAADLFPSSAHLDPDVNMTYDIDPDLAKKEKQVMLEECIRNNYRIVFQHGQFIEACTVSKSAELTKINPIKIASI